MLKANKVAIVKTKDYKYPLVAPYNPRCNYPEIKSNNFSSENFLYDSLRYLLYIYGLDSQNFGNPNWNPLQKFIKPGDTVVLKPNFVNHFNYAEYIDGTKDMDCVITHGSVIRFVLDYVAIALRGEGKIIVADCPIQGANWKKLLEIIGWDRISDYFKRVYPNIELKIEDYRLGKAVILGRTMFKRIVDESKKGSYYEIDLGRESLLVPLMSSNYEFGVSQYPKYRMKDAHTPDINKYLIPKEIINADCLINLPKMKSHMKSGITGALKNLVGINGHKDYLPHFRFGSPKQGGDEYPDGNWLWDLMWFFAHKEWNLDKGLRKIFYDNIFKLLVLVQIILGMQKKGFTRLGGGSWHGNDTLWRTIIDINRAFFYYDNESKSFSNNIQRTYFCIVDGLIGGHKESPLAPSPIKSNFFICGENPLAIDTITSCLMNFDFKKIPLIYKAYLVDTKPLAKFNFDQIEAILYDESLNELKKLNINDIYHYAVPFKPSLGFINYIEKE